MSRLLSMLFDGGGPMRMETPRHYACRVEFNGEAKFVAWYTADVDGFLRDISGRLVVADTAEALGVPLEVTEPVAYDFHRLRAWCTSPDAAGVDCRAFLGAWNFLDDLTGLHAGVDNEYTHLSRAAAGCYDKLFWGNNLPAVTPPGERFVPSWSPEELAAIHDVFEVGLCFLAAELVGSAQDAEPDAPSDPAGM